ncbi:MAG: hypothetical protein KC502_08935 [Myxococcales bacterium]|nr:hypothetical protein [Myxococcales bacterium]
MGHQANHIIELIGLPRHERTAVCCPACKREVIFRLGKVRAPHAAHHVTFPRQYTKRPTNQRGGWFLVGSRRVTTPSEAFRAQ